VTDIEIRRAVAADVPAIVAMLADDELGATRESPGDLAPYRAAFARLDQDPRQLLVVAARDGAVVGTLQLTFIAGLSRRGATRALIEAVRVDRAARGGPPGLPGRPADLRQVAHQGSPVLRAARLHRLARRLQAPARAGRRDQVRQCGREAGNWLAPAARGGGRSPGD
jgi:hypothetical protein